MCYSVWGYWYSINLGYCPEEHLVRVISRLSYSKIRDWLTRYGEALVKEAACAGALNEDSLPHVSFLVQDISKGSSCDRGWDSTCTHYKDHRDRDGTFPTVPDGISPQRQVFSFWDLLCPNGTHPWTSYFPSTAVHTVLLLRARFEAPCTFMLCNASKTVVLSLLGWWPFPLEKFIKALALPLRKQYTHVVHNFFSPKSPEPQLHSPAQELLT